MSVSLARGIEVSIEICSCTCTECTPVVCYPNAVASTLRCYRRLCIDPCGSYCCEWDCFPYTVAVLTPGLPTFAPCCVEANCLCQSLGHDCPCPSEPSGEDCGYCPSSPAVSGLVEEGGDHILVMWLGEFARDRRYTTSMDDLHANERQDLLEAARRAMSAMDDPYSRYEVALIGADGAQEQLWLDDLSLAIDRVPATSADVPLSWSQWFRLITAEYSR